jgi:hypothetical protein
MHLPEHLAAIVDSLDEHHTKIVMSVYDDLHPPIEDPVGLAFTPSTVIASWYNPSGSIEVMKEPITPTFKTKYQKTLHDYDATTEGNRYKPIPEQDLDDLTAVFNEAIAPLTAILTERLGHTPI